MDEEKAAASEGESETTPLTNIVAVAAPITIVVKAEQTFLNESETT
jgi:hypothetical protein